MRAIFFEKKIDSQQEILQRSKIPTVYAIFFVENVKELFRQLRQNGELQKNGSDMSAKNAYSTRWQQKVYSQLRRVEQLSNGNL